MVGLRIWLLYIAAAVVYGIAQDQVTARVCVKYFTLGHPPLFHTTSPTLLAFGWGIVASWWMGAILGVPVALCARAGRVFPFRLPGGLGRRLGPPLAVRQVVKPMIMLLVVMALCAFLAGLWGWGNSGVILNLGDIPAALPPARLKVFSADAFAHAAAYFVGFWGSCGLCFWILICRRRGDPAPRSAAILQMSLPADN